MLRKFKYVEWDTRGLFSAFVAFKNAANGIRREREKYSLFAEEYEIKCPWQLCLTERKGGKINVKISHGLVSAILVLHYLLLRRGLRSCFAVMIIKMEDRRLFKSRNKNRREVALSRRCRIGINRRLGGRGVTLPHRVI